MLIYPTLQDILGSLPPDERAELMLAIFPPGNTWPGETAEDSAT